MDIDEFRVQ